MRPRSRKTCAVYARIICTLCLRNDSPINWKLILEGGLDRSSESFDLSVGQFEVTGNDTIPWAIIRRVRWNLFWNKAVVDDQQLDYCAVYRVMINHFFPKCLSANTAHAAKSPMSFTIQGISSSETKDIRKKLRAESSDIGATSRLDPFTECFW